MGITILRGGGRGFVCGGAGKYGIALISCGPAKGNWVGAFIFPKFARKGLIESSSNSVMVLVGLNSVVWILFLLLILLLLLLLLALLLTLLFRLLAGTARDCEGGSVWTGAGGAGRIIPVLCRSRWGDSY